MNKMHVRLWLTISVMLSVGRLMPDAASAQQRALDIQMQLTENRMDCGRFTA